MCGNIMIFVACHKPYYIPSIDFLKGIQVGAALNNERFAGMLADNCGDNISNLNQSYCELTAQYWAWKNYKTDIVGFFHYRRYLKFICSNDNVLPYIIKKLPVLSELYKWGYDKENINGLFNSYDIVVPYQEQFYVSVYKQYVDSKDHYKKDLDKVIDIIKKRYPYMIKSMDEYLSSNMIYFGNVYVMKWNVFNNYMTWLFDILFEFDTQKDVKGYNKQALRVNGYLAERLFGIYLTYIINNTKLKICHVQKVHFECFEGSSLSYFKKKMINILLPPGSYRRFLVKKLFRG